MAVRRVAVVTWPCIISQLYVCVEYVNGGTLEELLSNKSRDVSWPTRVRLACDVAKGVQYLHSRKLMHRDLTSKVCHPSVCQSVCRQVSAVGGVLHEVCLSACYCSLFILFHS